MAQYIPDPILDADYFNASKIDNNFNNFAKWSVAVGDYDSGEGNIVNDRTALTSASFRPGCISSVFRSDDREAALFVLSRQEAPNLDDSVWEGIGGDFDVPGASINFYLRHSLDAGRLLVTSSFNMEKAREHKYEDAAIYTSVVFQFVFEGAIDGNFAAFGAPNVYKYYLDPAISNPLGGTAWSMPIHFRSWNESPLQAGMHTFKLRLRAHESPTGPGLPATATKRYNQIMGTGARTTVVALYR
jgi:hypothetical protein